MKGPMIGRRGQPVRRLGREAHMLEPTSAARRLPGLLLLALLAGCAGQEGSPTPPSAATTEPPSAATSAPAAASFDLALVKSAFKDGCANSRIDDEFCDGAGIDGWKARGMTLVVPTTLAMMQEEEARSICLVIQDARFEDPEGARLGFRDIAVLSRYGIDLATCWKPRF
jgi:hypothetical protein